MMHYDANHSSNAAAVEDFYPVELELGEGPGITSPEEDVDDGGSNVEVAEDVEGYLAVSEKFFA